MKHKDVDEWDEYVADLIGYFPDTPLIAFMRSGRVERYFGPFENGQEATDWMGEQPSSVRISFIPLRNPYIVRSVDDFYNPRKDLDETEFDHTRRETWQQYE